MKKFLAQTKVETLLTLRRGESVLVNLLIPIGALLFLHIDPPQLLAGVLTVAVIASAMVSVGIATGYERHYGVLKRLGGTPLGRPALLAAKATSTMLVQALQFCALLVVGLGYLGIAADVNVGRLLLVAGLGTFTFTSIGLLMAGTLRADINLALSNTVFLLLMVSGGLFVPEKLPSFASAMTYLPARPLREAMDWALQGGAAPTGSFVWLGLWGLAAATAASLKFSWE